MRMMLKGDCMYRHGSHWCQILAEDETEAGPDQRRGQDISHFEDLMYLVTRMPYEEAPDYDNLRLLFTPYFDDT